MANKKVSMRKLVAERDVELWKAANARLQKECKGVNATLQMVMDDRDVQVRTLTQENTQLKERLEDCTRECALVDRLLKVQDGQLADLKEQLQKTQTWLTQVLDKWEKTT